jgi:integrase
VESLGRVIRRRLHLLVLLLMDTGCRITEALRLRVSDIDFDNMLITLDARAESSAWCRGPLRWTRTIDSRSLTM